MNQDEQRLALFIDFENIAIGVRDAHYKKFDVNLVMERLLEKGKILVKKAYADWTRYADYRRKFHESAIELIEVPQKSIGGKNSADIRLVVDAMDLASQKGHINCFVIASGDSDFSPLVSKLKENGKHVIGLGVKNSTSELLIDNCDEFIFYEDLVRGQAAIPKIADVSDKVQECFALLVDSILALRRENKEILWGSMIKQTMQRKKPSFNEEYYGFRTFSALLEDAEKRDVIRLKKDQKSGSYLVVGFGDKEQFGGREALKTVGDRNIAEATRAPETTEGESGEGTPGAPKRRRRRRGGRGRGKGEKTGEPQTTEIGALEADDDGDDDDDSPFGDEWAGIPTEPGEMDAWSEEGKDRSGGEPASAGAVDSEDDDEWS